MWLDHVRSSQLAKMEEKSDFGHHLLRCHRPGLRACAYTPAPVVWHLLTVPQNPLLNAGIASVAVALNKPLTDIALLSGYMILTTAAVGPFTSALGRKYGKRPCYVFCSVIGTLGCVICETASSYNALVAGRVLEGVGIAAYESLAVASIGDLHFVHERGPRVAFMMFLLAAISNGISIIVSPCFDLRNMTALGHALIVGIHVCRPARSQRFTAGTGTSIS